MNNRNRLGNAGNRFQGSTKKVLCVCSAGLLRSPTAAVVLSAPPFNYNTRAVGVDKEFALIPVDEVLLEWADEVVCMERSHATELIDLGYSKPMIILDIKDDFEYRNPKLMREIRSKYQEQINEKEKAK